MKKIAFLVSVLLLLSMLWGCEHDVSKNFVEFYYPRLEYGYNREKNVFADSAFALEKRDNMGYQSMQMLLSIYLEGPEDPALMNPFPEELSIVDVHTNGTTLMLTVSDHLAELTGLPLIIACASLARTGMEMTGTSAAEIRCETALLDGKNSITLDENTVIYLDSTPIETAAVE